MPSFRSSITELIYTSDDTSERRHFSSDGSRENEVECSHREAGWYHFEHVEPDQRNQDDGPHRSHPWANSAAPSQGTEPLYQV